jgi:ankyrin repeat protein
MISIVREIGSVEEIKAFLTATRDDDSGGNFLHLSVLHGATRSLETLLPTGWLDVNSRDHEARTPMDMAVDLDNANCVSLLAHHGADVDAYHHQHGTLLYRAVLDNKHKAVKALLDADASVSKIQPHVGEEATPIHAAVRCQSQSLGVLMSHKTCTAATVNTEDRRGLTPLHHALVQGGNVSVLGLLVEGGARLRRDRDDVNLLEYLCIWVRDEPAFEEAWAFLSANAHNADHVDYFDINGPLSFVSPLHHAAGRGLLWLVKRLVANGADLEAEERFSPQCQTPNLLGGFTASSSRVGQTPLHRAVLQDNTAMALLLIKSGARLDHRTRPGTHTRAGRVHGLQVPLHLSTSAEMTTVLLGPDNSPGGGGASESATEDDAGFTPLSFAVHTGKIAVVRAMLEGGVSIEPDPEKPLLFVAMDRTCAKSEYDEMLELLVFHDLQSPPLRRWGARAARQAPNYIGRAVEAGLRRRFDTRFREVVTEAFVVAARSNVKGVGGLVADYCFETFADWSRSELGF